MVKKNMNENDGFTLAELLIVVATVSYTHLDVYKRQQLVNALVALWRRLRNTQAVMKRN